ncbi:putative glyoxalase superfamily metalloenzyme YdcJ [Pseudomonas duriflava]|uniref:2-oxoadipate dioxygenase/decarboxylase n=1 Tax=Pseudomonas duriflava TaxID=459528 RepID=A0A562Q6Y3_9PSED|nr:VOC family protein [Pseudomonas duriflava]TWI52497.1 putative glyoxalase superfamily metalloenzyme YdcJ [Pseudomonas duriflava]
MSHQAFVDSDEIRARFSRAMSDMYKSEVPLYGTLLELVAEVNRNVMHMQPDLTERLSRTGEIERLDMERHGAIRVGTPEELATIRRLFAVMGMLPVGYYDLSEAGVPVHSTAFRAVHEASLQRGPFRVFTSLLRLELIEDVAVRQKAEAILAKRTIFTPRALALIERFETVGGLTPVEADEFIQEALETFRWHSEATVSAEVYQQLHDQHRLIADIVAFKGPHINHLTPRTLDIDAVQAGMPHWGITPKAVIEGPPPRKCPVLLRQTSFKALQESIAFIDDQGATVTGSHTARFGEIEQRGVALTPKGRALYDTLLNAAREQLGVAPNEGNADSYMKKLSACFADLPDDYDALRTQGLAYFRYFATEQGLAARKDVSRPRELEALIKAGHIQYEPLVYEDFLPVSAAGIFQSNLGDTAQAHYAATSSREQFQQALGATVLDELALYEQTQQRSLAACGKTLGITV